MAWEGKNLKTATAKLSSKLNLWKITIYCYDFVVKMSDCEVKKWNMCQHIQFCQYFLEVVFFFFYFVGSIRFLASKNFCLLPD